MSESITSLSNATETRTPKFTYVLVTGGRDYTASPIIENAMLMVVARFKDVIFVNGGANGADTICSVFCLKHEWPVYIYPAKWNTHKKGAGPIRNRLMLDMHPDVSLVLAFHPFLPKSRGTYDMCKIALSRRIPVVHYDNNGLFQILSELTDLPPQEGK